MLKVFDAFSGIGALTKALHNLGIPYQIAAMSEIDVAAIISYYLMRGGQPLENLPPRKQMLEELINKKIGWDYKKNKTTLSRISDEKLKLLYSACKTYNNFGSIDSLNPNDLPDFDIFNFSFPCTSISQAGHREGLQNLDKSGLYFAGFNIIKTKMPKFVLIENVSELLRKRFINDFYNIIKEIEEVGYTCHYPINNDKPITLNAADFGVPQARERVCVVCIRKDLNIDYSISLPQPNLVNPRTFLESDTTNAKFCQKSATQLRWVNTQKNNPRKPQLLAYTSESGRSQSERLYDIDYPVPTILSSTQVFFKISDTEYRTLTPLEEWKLMGFTKEDYLAAATVVSKSQLHKQAGNSIVVPVLEYLFKPLIPHLMG